MALSLPLKQDMKADSILKEDLGLNKIKTPFHVSLGGWELSYARDTWHLHLHALSKLLRQERGGVGVQSTALRSDFGLKPSFAAQELCSLGQVPCTLYPLVSYLQSELTFQDHSKD